MKGCELCGKLARMFCESDEASLCWECDNKVHSANFLVAKHLRTLLCRTCQSPTPWKASGSNLGPTVSVCDSCSSSRWSNNNSDNIHQQEQESQSEDEDEEIFEDEDEYEDDDDDEEEEDGENQVVPWSEMGSSVPGGESSDEEEVSSGYLKRVGCSSSSHNYSTQSKRARISREDNEEDNHGEKGSKSNSSSGAIIDSLKRVHTDMVSDEQSGSATILGICQLSRDQIL